MPTTMHVARVVLAGTLAAASCAVVPGLTAPGTTAATTIEADAASGLPTGRRTHHPLVLATGVSAAPGGATTAQWAGGRQPTPPQPV